MSTPILEHQAPQPPAAGSRVTWRTGAAWGAAFTVPAVIAAVISGGYGHGSFAAFKVLYPIPLLLANIFEDVAPAMLALGLLQFPLYGAVLFMGTLRSKIVLAVLLVLHFLAVIACFAPLLSFIFD
jgi:hypothetical protein